MILRPLAAADLIYVVPMYLEMIEEAKKDERFVDYPFPTPQTGDEFELAMLALLRNPPPQWFCWVAIPQGRVPKAFLMGELVSRIWLAPRKSLLGAMLFVQPGFRHRNLATDLCRAFVDWGRESGVESVEVSFVPGTQTHKMWAAAGFKTFQATGVLMKDGKPFVGVPEIERKGEADGE
jgi:GNAT superfamily N-acetyltransferase